MLKIKIGIISDTHISKDIYIIDILIEKFFKDIDLIIHAGDYRNIKVIEAIKKHKKFIGVYGNNDGNKIRKELKEKEIIKLNGYKIGIYHGIGESNITIDNAYEVFKKDKLDVIIFGHSHEPIIKFIDKTLMLNPGTPTSKKKKRWHSIIILELEKDYINAQLRFFNKF
ncbi:hypothetical protein SAMN05428976_102129 [Clostridium sp. USBA 49]|uniref:YfcE family phosphodiesterase n=1 Tax=Clostridium TaxID=1485 RepID=UPI0009D034C4|nr:MULTISPECIES: YfcE family phosphodiesterase [Clostridium]SKA75517.1 hypothetical protein SAMN05428976_102129 [Clostridium sp. USBA 49]